MKNYLLLTFILSLFLISCSTEPEPIVLGKDACDFCKMSIANKNFGAEIVTKKGKTFKFDDTHCLIGFLDAGTVKDQDINEIYVVNFDEPHNFIVAKKAFYLSSEELKSPMGGNAAAFESETALEKAQQQFKGKKITWDQLKEH